MRPFALRDAASTSSYPLHTFNGSSRHHYPEGGLRAGISHTAHRLHAVVRQPNEPTYLSTALRSEDAANNPDNISLPFKLSIGHLREKTHRNVPYLRHSWSRIDFIAIVSFWVMFILASTGIEKGSQHIGIFRAVSVIRTARLLTVTSGTTVWLIVYEWTSFLKISRQSCTR